MSMWIRFGSNFEESTCYKDEFRLERQVFNVLQYYAAIVRVNAAFWNILVDEKH